MKRSIPAVFAILLAFAVAVAPVSAQAPAPATPATAAAARTPPFKSEELEQLVAPIALYPDPLLAQVLISKPSAPKLSPVTNWPASMQMA